MDEIPKIDIKIAHIHVSRGCIVECHCCCRLNDINRKGIINMDMLLNIFYRIECSRKWSEKTWKWNVISLSNLLPNWKFSILIEWARTRAILCQDSRFSAQTLNVSNSVQYRNWRKMRNFRCFTYFTSHFHELFCLHKICDAFLKLFQTLLLPSQFWTSNGFGAFD